MLSLLLEEHLKNKQNNWRLKKKTSLKFKSLKPTFQQQLAMKGAIPEDQLNEAAKMNLRELTKQKKFEEAREDLIYETRKCFIICT